MSAIKSHYDYSDFYLLMHAAALKRGKHASPPLFHLAIPEVTNNFIELTWDNTTLTIVIKYVIMCIDICDVASTIAFIDKYGFLHFKHPINNDIRIQAECLLPYLKTMTLPELAHHYAQRTERCVFCNAPLRSDLSLIHGYGQDCAKTWNMPFNPRAIGRQQELDL